jgi:hypothetical protein
MRFTGGLILDRSSLCHNSRSRSSLSWITLTSLAHNKSVSSRQISALPLGVSCKSETSCRLCPSASVARLAETLPSGSRERGGGLGAGPDLPVINSPTPASAEGDVPITVRVVSEVV